MDDLPLYMRQLIAQHLGMRIEHINAWIDSGNESGLKRIEMSIICLSEMAKAEQQSRAGLLAMRGPSY